MAEATPVPVEEAVVRIPLEELNQFKLANGQPCYVVTSDADWDQLELNDVDMGFVLSLTTFDFKDNNVAKTRIHPQIFRFRKDIMGRALVPAPSDVLGKDKTKVSAQFNLPKIPQEMVAKLDTFFRAAEDRHGTEAIIILTWDPKIGGSEGWGILTPKQENTAGHCDYKPESIVAQKPKSAYVVGSVHSHPKMSAFASSTDHKDQADFDGLHITYGWQAKNNYATEYHVELQVMGQTFYLNPTDVFEAMPAAALTPEIEGWLENVSVKEVDTKQYNHWEHYGQGGTGTHGSNVSRLPAGRNIITRPKVVLPEGAPDFRACIYVTQLTKNPKKCPCCHSSLMPTEITRRRCIGCNSFLLMPGETIEDIHKIRLTLSQYTVDLDPAKRDSTKIVIYNPSAKSADSKFHIFWDGVKESPRGGVSSESKK